jgi:hypothetical protein
MQAFLLLFQYAVIDDVDHYRLSGMTGQRKMNNPEEEKEKARGERPSPLMTKLKMMDPSRKGGEKNMDL